MATFNEILNSRLGAVADFMSVNIKDVNERNVDWFTIGGVPNEWFYRFTFSDKIKSAQTRVEYTSANLHNGDGIEFKANVDLIGQLESGREFSITIENVVAYFRVNTDSDFRTITEAVVEQYKLLEKGSDWSYRRILPNAEMVCRAIQRLSDAYWKTERGEL